MQRNPLVDVDSHLLIEMSNETFDFLPRFYLYDHLTLKKKK